MELARQVAGGDGTASWLLGVVSDLKLPKPPPIATVPLGTGNNLPFSFGWVGYMLYFFVYQIIKSLLLSHLLIGRSNVQGKKNPGIDPQSVETFLYQVREAKEMKIDR